jgi:PAS domain S-box-containing protein
MARIRLKTKLVLAISAMVVALVAGFASIYVTQVVHHGIDDAYTDAGFIANQVLDAAQAALQIDLSSTKVDTEDPAAVSAAIDETLQTDPALNSLLQSIVGYSPTVYDVIITDLQGRTLLHTNPELIGKTIPPREDFTTIERGTLWQQLKIIYGPSHVYERRMTFERNGAPFGMIRVGLSTVFVKSQLRPVLDRALLFSGIAIFVSLILAAGLSNVALRPLEAISRRLDMMNAGAAEPIAEHDPSRTDEVGVVTTKIDRLGRQMRDVQSVFSALKENLDQIMANLQDGIMLFTRDSRAVLVSASIEGFLGKSRGDMLGSEVWEIFNDGSALSRLVLDAYSLHQSLSRREVNTENGRRLGVSLDFIEERGERIGALLTLRDAESVQKIEEEVELSRRLAAIGRLTSGVAHEVKNPINAIVVHLEVLRQKLQQVDPATQRHVEVIGNEIRRLDRVVQTLVDFTKPVELHLAEQDLRRVVEDVVLLASPEAESLGVRVLVQNSPEPLPAKVDSDLVKQALLNVVLNGVQAMAAGGELNIRAVRVDHEVQVEVHDQGDGIPPEVRDKIFNLYFTTKKMGTGIGLAMTYRVMQLHNGTVEFDSRPGQGTTFRLRFPLSEPQMESQTEVAART